MKDKVKAWLIIVLIPGIFFSAIFTYNWYVEYQQTKRWAYYGYIKSLEASHPPESYEIKLGLAYKNPKPYPIVESICESKEGYFLYIFLMPDGEKDSVWVEIMEEPE